MAKEKGLTYVKLDGNVGILANGAGLCMSTLDVVAQAGGAPANFLDAGGGSKAEAIVDALDVITSDPKVRAILFNIFGGITRCDEIAKGIVTASRATGPRVPLVVRLDGTNSEQGLKILAEANLPNLAPGEDDARGRAAGRRAGRWWAMSIIVDEEHQARRLRADRSRGLLSRTAQHALMEPIWLPASPRARAARRSRGCRSIDSIKESVQVGGREYLDDLRSRPLRRRGDR